jgi:hypothetical protein
MLPRRRKCRFHTTLLSIAKRILSHPGEPGVTAHFPGDVSILAINPIRCRTEEDCAFLRLASASVLLVGCPAATIVRRSTRVVNRAWRLLHEHEIADARVEHIATLHRLKRDTWNAGDAAKDGEGNPVGFLNLVRQIEMDLAKLDGSLSRTEPQLTSDGEPFTFTLQLDNANAPDRRRIPGRHASGSMPTILLIRFAIGQCQWKRVITERFVLRPPRERFSQEFKIVVARSLIIARRFIDFWIALPGTLSRQDHRTLNAQATPPFPRTVHHAAPSVARSAVGSLG